MSATVTATNRDLPTEVSRGTFRSICIAPLARRRTPHPPLPRRRAELACGCARCSSDCGAPRAHRGGLLRRGAGGAADVSVAGQYSRGWSTRSVRV